MKGNARLRDDARIGRAMIPKTKLAQSSAMGRARGPLWPPWMEVILVGWRRRWPAAFSRPVPLAVGISRHIKEVLRAEGETIDRKSIGTALHPWTMHGAYLRAVVRGEMRRNLDGSPAGVPDEAARQSAQTLLGERAARQAERERQEPASLGDEPESQRL